MQMVHRELSEFKVQQAFQDQWARKVTQELLEFLVHLELPAQLEKMV